MTNLTRHVGRLNNTGTRVVVVFRNLPDDVEHCLVIESDRLPDRMHDNIMEILKSKEAQNTFDLYEVLGRRTFTEGGNVLQTLHKMNFLRRVPVKEVTLYPLPNNALPLELANTEVDKVKANNKKTSIAEGVKSLTGTTPQKANTPVSTDQLEIARSLIVQAEMLEEDARKKKEEAYSLAPELKPKKGRPAKTTLNEDIVKTSTSTSTVIK